MKEITQDHLKSVCKYRQGKDTCKYIVYLFHTQKYHCGKTDLKVKQMLDQKDGMTAQGDNCGGFNASSAVDQG